MTILELLKEFEAKRVELRKLLEEIACMTEDADYGQVEIAKEAIRILEN